MGNIFGRQDKDAILTTLMNDQSEKIVMIQRLVFLNLFISKRKMLNRFFRKIDREKIIDISESVTSPIAHIKKLVSQGVFPGIYNDDLFPPESFIESRNGDKITTFYKINQLTYSFEGETVVPSTSSGYLVKDTMSDVKYYTRSELENEFEFEKSLNNTQINYKQNKQYLTLQLTKDIFKTLINSPYFKKIGKRIQMIKPNTNKASFEVEEGDYILFDNMDLTKAFFMRVPRKVYDKLYEQVDMSKYKNVTN